MRTASASFRSCSARNSARFASVCAGRGTRPGLRPVDSSARPGRVAAFGVEIADPRREIERRRTRRAGREDRERAVAIAARRLHLAEADHRVRIVGKEERRAAILALRVSSRPMPQLQLAGLRRVPGLRLGIVAAVASAAICITSSAPSRSPAARARTRRARTRRRSDAARSSCRTRERLVVLAELEQRVAHDAVVPRVAGPQVARAPGRRRAPRETGAATDRWRRASAARRTGPGSFFRTAVEHLGRAARRPPVVGRARLTQQRVGQQQRRRRSRPDAAQTRVSISAMRSRSPSADVGGAPGIPTAGAMRHRQRPALPAIS